MLKLGINLIFCRKMNTYRCPTHKSSLDDLKSINKYGGFPSIYVMSRIEGLAQAIWSLGNKFSEDCDVAEVVEITVPVDTDIIDIDVFGDDLRYSEIVVCDTTVLGHNFKIMPRLKWAHSTFAGVEPLFEMIQEKPNFIVTRHSHEDFGEQMAEYIMAQILNLEKNYRNIWTAMAEKSWSKIRHYSSCSLRQPIKELQLGILGVGNMGQAIARFFKPHGTGVIGFGRSPRNPSEFGYFDKISLSLTEVISSSDYIINTLPSTPNTVGMLDGDVLEVCKKSPVFINVGRGDIIHENTVLAALEKNWLRHAVLDVFENEPLPPESMLWSSDKITITPHCSAISFPKLIAEDFLMNLLRYLQKKPLQNVVDWQKGY